VPLQVDAVCTAPLLHPAAKHWVPAGCLRQAPAPSQEPSLPQVVVAVASHSRRGSVPASAAMHVPTLLLMGEDEVIYDPAAALERARRLVPDFRGELVPSSNHDMCFSQHAVVDARVLEFLSERRREISERIVA